MINIHNFTDTPVIDHIDGPEVRASEFAVNLPIKCVVTSKPAAEIIWSRDGSVITLPSDEYEVANQNTSDPVIPSTTTQSKLIIKKVGKTHFGRYSCKAKNKHGEVEKSTQVVVTCKLILSFIGLTTCSGRLKKQ